MPADRRPADPAQAAFRKACADLDKRLRAGEAAAAEEWVAGHLSADADLAVELIFTEYVTREELGQAPDPAEYYRRFPGYADRLARLFGVDQLFQESAGGKADTPGAFDRTPATAGRSATPPAAAGPFELHEKLGSGGMGVVYRGYHPRLKREVAVKLLRGGGGAGPAELARLKTEAEAVARLNHPNIVQIFEVGEADGQPYLALEYVAGKNLRDHLAGRALAPAEAASVAESLARAVAHAHSRNVVHRDLKPANVLLAADGTPKVTDFGLAALADAARATASGQLVGTAAYMPPEQADARPGWVTPAVDIYSCGAVLYEMLTGRPPFLADTPLETLSRVLLDDPVRPRELSPKVPRDLETVCLTCLEKDPARRYATADALADDLGRFLAGEPVHARPASARRVVAKWVRRRPALAAAVAVAVVAAVALTAGGVIYTTDLADERDATAAKKRDADAATARAESEFTRAEAMFERTQNMLYASQVGRAAAAARANPQAARDLLHDADACPPERRDFVWHYLDQMTDVQTATAAIPPGGVNAVAGSADGTRIVTAGADGAIRVWDGATLAAVCAFENVHPGGATAAAVSADGTRAVSAGRDGKVKVWNLTTAAVAGTLVEYGGPVFAVAITRDGRTVATGATAVELFDTGTGAKKNALPKPGTLPRALAFSPDGARLAAGYARLQEKSGEFVVWDVAAATPTFAETFATGYVTAAAFAADGHTVAAGALATNPRAEAPTVRIYDAAGAVRATVGVARGVWGLAFADDGRSIAVAELDGLVGLWDARSGVRKVEYAGHDAGPSPNPRTMSAFQPRAVYSPTVTAAESNRAASGVAVAAGAGLVTAGSDAFVRRWAADPDRLRRFVTAPRGRVSAAAVAAGGLLVGGDDGSLWRADGTFCGGPAGAIGDIALSPDGRRVALAAGGAVRVRDTATGAEPLAVPNEGVFRVWYTGGKLLAWNGKTMQVLDPDTGEPAGESDVAPASDVLAAAWIDGKVVVATRRGVIGWPGLEESAAGAAAFSADGVRVALVGREGGVRSTTVTIGFRGASHALKFPSLGSLPTSAAFSHDGRMLAVAFQDSKVRVWVPGAGHPLLELDAGGGSATKLKIAADGRSISVVAVATGGPRAVYWSLAQK